MWQRVLSPNIGEIDPEHERELRLVAQARAGAAWALSALVARYQPPVVRYLVRLTGSADRGRALAEEVLVRMAKRVRGPHGGDQLRLWLLRTSTEVGLDALRHPQRAEPRRLGEVAGPVALIAERVGDTPVGRWVAGWGTRLRPQEGPRIPARTQQFIWQESAETPALEGEEHDQLTPRDAIKYRMVRAVLAELPYGDAQCLSLHLVAGLNQTEVAQALGIAPAVARRRIVQGLQLFGRRYEAALASLGLAPDFVATTGYSSAHDGELPASAPSTGAISAPARAVLDAPGVVDADEVTQPLDPILAAPSETGTLVLEVPGSQLTSPMVAGAGAESPAPEFAEAEERALTSAAIMAYLRTAAANVRPHQEAPAIVAAVPVAEPLVPVIDAATPSHASERGDVASAESGTGLAPDPAERNETLVPVAHGGSADGAEAVISNEAPITETTTTETISNGSDGAPGTVTEFATAMVVPALNKDAGEMVREMAVAAPRREPRMIPVFNPVNAIEPVTGMSIPAAPVQVMEEAVPPEGTEATVPPSAHDAPRDEVPVATLAEAITSTASGVEDGAVHADHVDSPLALADVAATIATDEAPVLASATVPSATTNAEDVDADDESADGADHYMLVVEPESESPPEDPRRRFTRARRTRVLSADGEAEDPSDMAIWPVS